MRKATAVVFLLFLLLPAFSEEKSLFEQGSELYRYKKYEAARVKFEEALVRDGADERVYLYLGTTYQALGKYDKAIEILKKGLSIVKENKHLLFINIGNCYFSIGDFVFAEKNYSFAIAENGAYPDSFLQRANAYMKLKTFKEAATDYRTYLRLKPDSRQRRKIEELLAALETDAANQASLLDSILNSLKNASGDTDTQGAGTEEFKTTNGNGDGDIID